MTSPVVEKTPAGRPGRQPEAEPAVASISPALALAWSEALVSREEALARPLLALWSPAGISAAIGLAQDPERELNIQVLRRDGVGWVRRSSGGGAVILARGALCWEATAPFAWLAERGGAGIRDAYAALSAPILSALRRLGLPAFPAGVSDISLPGAAEGEAPRKLAGTAQLRRRSHVLVHGSILLDLDLGLLSRYLRQPSRQPEYRAGRPHDDFCRNAADWLGLAGPERQTFPGLLAREIAARARDAGWDMGRPPERDPDPETLRLAGEKYLSDSWNRRRRPFAGAGNGAPAAGAADL